MVGFPSVFVYLKLKTQPIELPMKTFSASKYLFSVKLKNFHNSYIVHQSNHTLREASYRDGSGDHCIHQEGPKRGR